MVKTYLICLSSIMEFKIGYQSRNQHLFVAESKVISRNRVQKLFSLKEIGHHCQS